MKKALLLIFLFTVTAIVNAQKVYFIYLQSEGNLPFYIKMGDKIMSSTTEGYLIVPKLRDSAYNFLVGYPGKQEETRFEVQINKSDRGFLVKNFNDALSLFDLQSLTVFNPVQAAATTSQSITKNDSFTKLLSKAADDSTLLNETVMIKEKKSAEEKVEPVKEKQTETAPTEIIKKEAPVADSVTASAQALNIDTVAIVHNEASQKNNDVINNPASTVVEVPQKNDEKIVEENSNETEYRKSVVLKHAESSTSDGFGLVFLDVYEGLIDTIRIVIPNPQVTTTEIKQSSPPVENLKFLDITDSSTTSKIDGKEIKPEITVQAPAVTEKQKPLCSALATDDDFFKMRRDMASKKSEDEMIAQAKKYFKNKCFRTEQLKYLSVLFLTESGKYQFFDAAYLHVSDVQKFETLQSELSDAYYINRFKALMGK